MESVDESQEMRLDDTAQERRANESLAELYAIMQVRLAK